MRDPAKSTGKAALLTALAPTPQNAMGQVRPIDEQMGDGWVK